MRPVSYLSIRGHDTRSAARIEGMNVQLMVRSTFVTVLHIRARPARESVTAISRTRWLGAAKRCLAAETAWMVVMAYELATEIHGNMTQ
jgi:hypothetical protein